MARFDVHALKDGRGLVIDCQADLLRDLNTRFVVPLLPYEQAPRPASVLNPTFDLDGGRYVMATQFAAAVHARELGEVMASLSADEIRIGRALDMLISGI